MIADNLPIDEILNLVIEKFQNYIDEENEKFIELTKINNTNYESKKQLEQVINEIQNRIEIYDETVKICEEEMFKHIHPIIDATITMYKIILDNNKNLCGKILTKLQEKIINISQ